MSKIECPVCGSTPQRSEEYINGQFAFLEGVEDIFSASNIQICQGCTYSFAYPFITEQKLSAFYRDHYRRHIQSPFYGENVCGGERPAARDIAQVMLAAQFARRMSSFLDIGAGTGNSVAAAKRFNPLCACHAVEADSYAKVVLQSRGVNVIHPKAANFDLGREYSQHFDVVLMSHVLEHCNGCDVLSVLRNVRKLVADGGVLVLEVPNDDFTKDLPQRTNDAPHLSFFSPQALRRALERAGWEILLSEVGEVRRGPLLRKGGRVSRRQASVGSMHRRLRRMAVENVVPRWFYCTLVKLWLAGRSLGSIWRDSNFKYGVDKTCMRVVARPSSVAGRLGVHPVPRQGLA